jgi:hypothetical protein
MPNTDWLPSRDQDFADLCQNWKNGLSNPANVAAFGWKQDEVNAVLAAVDSFLTALAAYREDDSSANRLKKDGNRGKAKELMRDFANTSIRFNKLMDAAAKLYYGIGRRDDKPSVEGEPKTYPEADADTSVLRQVTIHYWDSATKKRAKPRGIHGAEVRWALLDHPPASEKELLESDFDTASPLTLKFDESDRGRRLYFCLRWESNTNLKGPYGEIYSAVIP